MAGEVDGYPKLAAYMGSRPTNLIFRGFQNLNIEILLHRQAELTDFEAKLRQLQQRDATSSVGNAKAYARDWRLLSLSHEENNDNQLNMLKKIRLLLKEYNEHVIQVATISKLERPNPSDLLSLRQWLKHPRFGHIPLEGPDGNTWGALDVIPQLSDCDEIFKDLFALSPRHEEDLFSRFVSDRCVPIFHQIFRSDRADITVYSETKLRAICSVFTTITSSLLPVITIITLYEVNHMGLRLALVAIFTSLFSIAVTLTTNAMKADIFASTTAFAAVQVVFIGTTSGSCGTE